MPAHLTDCDAGRLRLDQALVARGLSASRARARDAILRGHVTVDGRRAEKPAELIAAGQYLTLDDPAGAFVSRAALKLAAGLDAFGLDPAGTIALDIGASTGGFTELLLARGAVHVTAIDVGHGQLHERLAGDPSVTAIEGLNARDLEPAHLAAPPSFIVADVSFISLKLALAPALALATPKAAGVFLVKPQFEIGRAELGKGGIVRNPAAARAAAEAIAAWLDGRERWQVLGLVPSPLTGGDGNHEFLLGGRRG